MKSLMFDLGDVIVGLDFDRAYRATERLTGRAAGEMPEIIRRAGIARPYERGEISNEEFYQRFCRALGLRVSYERFCEIWEDMFQPEPLIEDRFLASLSRSYRLILLSNTNEIHFRSIQRRFPLLRHFHDFVLSYQVGVMKPAEGIYLEAVRRAQCLPAECFFTDDKTENVEAAKKTGIDAVRFLGAERLQDELRRRGIFWDGIDEHRPAEQAPAPREKLLGKELRGPAARKNFEKGR